MGAILSQIIAMGLSMLGMVGFVTMSNHSIENIRTSATAGQLIVFDKAAAQYVSDYAATIAEVATSTTPANITTAMLINTGYLPSGFSAKNPFGQTWLAQVLQPSSGELETLVTSQDGTAISNQLQLVQIAAQAGVAGVQGGFIPYANQGGDSSLTASTAQGAYGGWSVPMTNFTNPGSGHLASLLAYQNTTANTSYLYRVAVSGQPQLNAMQTDLSMEDTSGTKHDINDVETVNTGNVVTSAGNGLQIGNSKFYADSTNTALRQSGDLYVQDLNGSASATKTYSGMFAPQTQATAGASCSINGAIATSGSGPLFCLSGVWVHSDLTQNGSYTAYSYGGTTVTSIGTHALCYMAGYEAPSGNNSSCTVINVGNNTWQIWETLGNVDANGSWCQASCIN